VLQGVEEYCEEAGYFVIYTRFRYSPDTRPAELQLPSVLQSHGIADCVILAGANYENFTGILEKRGIHYVLLVNNFASKRVSLTIRFVLTIMAAPSKPPAI
jgi:DNA-binding LacI/PurR family transcriptional regulator